MRDPGEPLFFADPSERDNEGDATAGGRTAPTGNTGDAGGAGRAGEGPRRRKKSRLDPGGLDSSSEDDSLVPTSG